MTRTHLLTISDVPFGERWSVDVMPQTLMELMRHESMETTLKFYVGRNAEKTADTLYKVAEAKLRTTLRSIPENEQGTQKEKDYNSL